MSKSKKGRRRYRISLRPLALPKKHTVEGEFSQDTRSSSLENMKGWLSRNKIFFETIAAFTLTLMAIIISVAQLRVSSQQTELLESQVIIERELASPAFIIDVELLQNEEGIYSDEMIYVYNEGYLAYNIDIDTAVFFELTYSNGKNPKDYSKVKIPINGYFSYIALTGEGKNLVGYAGGK